jgi:O-methyltransferase involved in polyketide biosynthesis
MAHDFAKISLTARFVAYMRLFTDIPYATDIAELIRARAAFDAFLRPHKLTPEDLHFYAPIFEARYKSINAMIRRINPRQILEIGTGLSPRGFNITADAQIFYVETDLPEIVEEKRLLLGALQRRHHLIPHNNLRLTVANALERDQLQAAASAFKSGQRLVILHEGLLQYLSASETERVAGNIHKLLGQYGGAWITPDFSLRSDAEHVSEEQKYFRRVIAQATDRTLYNNAFDSIEHLREYYRSLGFQVEVFNQLYLAPDLVSPQRLKLKPELLDELRPRLRLFSLTRIA